MSPEACTICNGDVAICPRCSALQAFRIEAKECVCYSCKEEIDNPYLASPFVDPEGKFQSHLYCKECLPKECIPID